MLFNSNNVDDCDHSDNNNHDNKEQELLKEKQ